MKFVLPQCPPKPLPAVLPEQEVELRLRGQKMSDSWYDTAYVCENRHTITPMSVESPETVTMHCGKCGEAAISACLACNEPIRGYHYIARVTLAYKSDFSDYSTPGFCHNCGDAYPWTVKALKAAQELADQLHNLTPEEKNDLKTSVKDIIRDTPQARVASQRIKTSSAKQVEERQEPLKIYW